MTRRLPALRPVGGVAEWSNAAVLKTVERVSVPWVRIPPPPPLAAPPFSLTILIARLQQSALSALIAEVCSLSEQKVVLVKVGKLGVQERQRVAAAEINNHAGTNLTCSAKNLCKSIKRRTITIQLNAI